MPTPMAPLTGRCVMQAIKDGDQQALENSLHGLSRHQAYCLLHYRHKQLPREDLTPLLATIKFRRVHMMKYILRVYKVDIEQRGIVVYRFSDKYHSQEKIIEPGATALWYAAAEDLMDYVEPLVETYGADVNAPSDRNTTPLHMACSRGNLNMITLLLKHGAKPNVKNNCDDLTPILCLLPVDFTMRFGAVTYSSNTQQLLEKIQVLVKHKANINARTKTSQTTLLHQVAETGIIEVYKYLVSQGAKYTVDKYEQTPLHTACLNGKREFYKYLCTQPHISKQDRLCGMELLYVCTLMDNFMHCYDEIDEIMDMRKLIGSKKLRAAHSKDLAFVEGHEVTKPEWSRFALWKEGVLIIAKRFGTESLHFATRLFQFTSHHNLWEGVDNSVMIMASLEMICCKHKLSNTFLPIYITLQLVRHLESPFNCYQHNLSNAIKVLRMSLAVLQNDYLNEKPMITGRTANIIETNSFFKAAMDSLGLLLVHRWDTNNPEFRRLLKEITDIGDKMVGEGHTDYSFFHWIMDLARVEGSGYSPVRVFDLAYYVVQLEPDVNVYDHKGQSSLHLLAKYNKNYSDKEFALLLHKMQDCNMHFDLVDEDGFDATELCKQHSPDRAHYFIEIASAYISLKCLAARVVQKSVPQYARYLPRQLEYFVSMH